jgi:uncharacterized protein YgiM (DUF1202 family)
MAFFLVLACSARAAGSDEYLDVYKEILQADGLAESGHSAAAAFSYLQAQNDLRDFQARHPSWSTELVNFRLEYLAEKLQSLSKYLPSTNAPPVVAPPPIQPPVRPQSSTAAVTQQIAGLQEQIRSLIDANTELQGKLKEALSVQPAAVSPAELAKAEAKTLILEKERDLLTVALDQKKAASASTMTAIKAAPADQEIVTWKARADAIEQKSRKELAQARESAAELEKKVSEATKELESMRAERLAKNPTGDVAKQNTEERNQLKAQQAEIAKDEAQIARLTEALLGAEKKVAAANSELDTLKAARVAEAHSAEELKAVAAERDQLKEELAGHSKDLAEADARANQELSSVRAALQQAEQRRDESEKKLVAANSELDTLKAARAAEAHSAEEAKAVAAERDKLKEELAGHSKDMAKAEERANQELSSARAALQQAEQRRDELEKKMAAANSELDTLKATRTADAHSAEEAKAVAAERDKLKEELAGHSKDLAEADARANQELSSVRAALQQAEQRRDELEKKLADVAQANVASSKAAEVALKSPETSSAATATAIEPATKPAQEPAAKTSPTNVPGFKNSMGLNPPFRAIVKCDVLSVRSQGSFAGEVINQLKQGESVTVLEEITSRGGRPGEPGQWSRIAMPANTPVWVKATLIDPETKTVRVSKLNVRGGPGERYSIVAQLNQGAAVNEILEKEGWLEIETPTNACAFVASEYLQLPAPGVVVSLAPSTPPAPATAPPHAN